MSRPFFFHTNYAWNNYCKICWLFNYRIHSFTLKALDDLLNIWDACDKKVMSMSGRHFSKLRMRSRPIRLANFRAHEESSPRPGQIAAGDVTSPLPWHRGFSASMSPIRMPHKKSLRTLSRFFKTRYFVYHLYLSFFILLRMAFPHFVMLSCKLLPIFYRNRRLRLSLSTTFFSRILCCRSKSP